MAKVVGIDVGFVSLGWSVFDIQGPELEDWTFLECGCVQTKRYEDGENCPVIVDDFRRGNKIANEIQELIDVHKPLAIVCEVPTGSQSALGAKGLGVGVGILAAYRTISNRSEQPIMFEFLLPGWVKGAVTGDKRASKEDVVAGFREDLPDAVEAAQSLSNKRAREDVGDSIAALVAARLRNSKAYQMVLTANRM